MESAPVDLRFALHREIVPMSPASSVDTLALLKTQRNDLADRLSDLRDRLAALAPELEYAKGQAAKPTSQASGNSIEAILASTTEAAIEHHTWQAKVEAIETTMQWATHQIASTEAKLREVEDQIDIVQQKAELTADAKAGIEALNTAVADLKQQLIALQKRGCTHIYSLNLPEFSLDDRGSIQARPVAFRMH
jgi:chromosome segregation ATPase